MDRRAWGRDEFGLMRPRYPRSVAMIHLRPGGPLEPMETLDEIPPRCECPRCVAGRLEVVTDAQDD